MSRPHKGSSISDLKLMFEANADNLSVLEALLHELGFRKTPSARRLLAKLAERIADLGEEDDALNGDVDDNSGISFVEKSETPKVNAGKRPVRNENLFGKASQDYELPPDDVKRPPNLSRIRPPGTPGLPSSFQKPLDQNFSPELACGAPYLRCPRECQARRRYISVWMGNSA